MSIKRSDRVLILKYKLSFEEEIDVRDSHEQGLADFLNHLNYFKQKLSETAPEQVESFNDTFFNKSANNLASNKKDTDDVDNEKSNEASRHDNHKPWAKKLYKSIVTLTHPDKTRNLNIDVLVEKLTSYYLLAVESYAKKDYHNLIMIGFDLDIEFDSGLIVKEIYPALQRSKKIVILTKSKLGYQWSLVPEKSKRETLKTHLEKMGFNFTEEDITSAMDYAKRKCQRKPGQRPVKNSRIALK
jgi:hypothetical protein